MKIKFGAMVVDGRGKVGGQVASKNRGGAYLKNKVTPINPRSSAQLGVRATFTSLSQGWRSLTATQQAAWRAAVVNFNKKDIFGDLRNPSGSQLYSRLNLNILNANGAQINVPPALSVTPAVVNATITAAAGTPALSIVFTPAPVPAGIAYVIEATAQLSQGKNFVRNQFRKINVLAPAAVSPNNALATYTARFGALTAGSAIFFRFTAVVLASGIKSQSTVTRVVVAP